MLNRQYSRLGHYSLDIEAVHLIILLYDQFVSGENQASFLKFPVNILA
jgi:hypothetical protein